MTADFGNFVAKNDEKRKTKDEMNPAINMPKTVSISELWKYFVKSFQIHGKTLTYMILNYRVSHMETSDSKWLRGVEGLMIFLNQGV